MGFDLTMIWTTTYNKETGRPYANSPPEVPEKYREFITRRGWFWANFVPHDEETMCSAHQILELHAVDWDEIDWDNLNAYIEGKDREEHKEEYTRWREALEWFAEHGFEATWWW